jgi:hypothetical protein
MVYNEIENSFTSVYNYIKNNYPDFVNQINTVDSFQIALPNVYEISNTPKFSNGTNLIMNYIKTSYLGEDYHQIGYEASFFIDIYVSLGLTNNEITIDKTLKRYMDSMYNLFRRDTSLGSSCDVAAIMDATKLYDEDFSNGYVSFDCKYIIAF